MPCVAFSDREELSLVISLELIPDALELGSIEFCKRRVPLAVSRNCPKKQISAQDYYRNNDHASEHDKVTIVVLPDFLHIFSFYKENY